MRFKWFKLRHLKATSVPGVYTTTSSSSIPIIPLPKKRVSQKSTPKPKPKTIRKPTPILHRKPKPPSVHKQPHILPKPTPPYLKYPVHSPCSKGLSYICFSIATAKSCNYVSFDQHLHDY